MKKKRYATSVLFAFVLLCSTVLLANEYHVSVDGSDRGDGSRRRPLRHIQAAAEKAGPGDVITVHGGIYRERITPPRGGESDTKRIVYQAASGEKVVITGSEPIKGWKKVGNDTWKVVIPNSFFGDYNPYKELIHGDWFSPHGRLHHTGSVFLDGHWLIEAAKLGDVLKPAGENPLWFGMVDGDVVEEAGGYLMNIAGFRTAAAFVAADKTSAKNGTKPADCSEGGRCIGWITSGNWVTYKGVDFGSETRNVEFRAAAETGTGGVIELRLDDCHGQLLGKCEVPETGGWQNWKSFTAKIKPTGGVHDVCLVFKARPQIQPLTMPDSTTIWAQFKGVNPNRADVEINVRPTVFTPDRVGINYLTIRGFDMRNAATNWAPPTAGQFGLVSAYWCKGWIIENNHISYSKCSGIALGKHGDEFDNTSADSAEGYVETIKRAYKNGWSRENIGHHIVRNNCIHHCEQTGIVGSMGSAFSTITGNEIHDIHMLRLFGGAEMGGIKFHGAVDTEISGNHIYRVGGIAGIWLDWMTQGTRVAGNLMHDNKHHGDIFLEVNHGPYVVANNILLSERAVTHCSNGGAFVHNLCAGNFRIFPEYNRQTPYLEPHGVRMTALKVTEVGDDRWYNNLIVGAGSLGVYDNAKLPVTMDGNVFLKGSRASKHETAPLVVSDFDPDVRFTQNSDGSCWLELALEKSWSADRTRKLVTTDALGKSLFAVQAYELPDGSPLKIDADYFGTRRNGRNPFPGPFEISEGGRLKFKVWPLK